MTSCRLKILVTAAVFAGAVAFIASPALAVHDLDLFEVDGNAVDDGAVLGDDWDTPPGGIAFTGILDDVAPMTIFWRGGSKDIRDIPNWHYKDGSVPDKDDLTNAYAAAYEDNGDLIVYFGADRFGNDGDAQMGFWFFQNDVTLNGDGQSFTSAHKVGDILVLVNFVQGGVVPLIQVLEWNPAMEDVADNLHELFPPALALCGAVSGDNVCAITNSSPQPAPWSYTPKSGPAGTLPEQSFFEGGINVSALLGSTPCFSSFLAETRSSQSETSQLKDFVLDQFAVCSIDVTKVCGYPAVDLGTETVTYTIAGLIENTGFADVTNLDVTDSPVPIDALSLDFFNTNQTKASLVTLAQLTDTNNQDGMFDPANHDLAPDDFVIWIATITSEMNGFTDTVTATAEGTFGGVIPAAMANANCPSVQYNPAIDVNKSCVANLVVETSGNFLTVEVGNTITICNIGDVPINNAQLNDPLINDGADLLSVNTTLAVGDGNCPPGSGFESAAVTITLPYTPDMLPLGANGTFMNTVTATGELSTFIGAGEYCVLDEMGTTDPADDIVVCTDTATATCDLCPLPVVE